MPRSLHARLAPQKTLALAGASLALGVMLSSTPAEAQEAPAAPPAAQPTQAAPEVPAPPAAPAQPAAFAQPAAPAPPVAPAAAPTPPPYPYPYYAYPYTWQPPPPPPKPLHFSSPAELPPDEEGQFEPGLHRKVNTGKAGKILIGIGVGLAVVGGALTLLGATNNRSRDDFSRGLAEDVALPFGVGSMVTGGVCLLVGIPLLAASPR